MNFLSVSRAARASSCEGGHEGEEVLEGEVVLPVVGEMLVDGGPIENGLVVTVPALLVLLWAGIAVEGREWVTDVSTPMGEMSISSWLEFIADAAVSC